MDSGVVKNRLHTSFVGLKFGSTNLAAAIRALTLSTLLLVTFQPTHAQNGSPIGNTQPVAGPQRPANVPVGYLITPAGYFHPTCVRSLAKGDRLMADRRVQYADGTIDQEVAVCNYPHYTPDGNLVSASATTPEISGWLENANILTGSANISYGALIAWWTVPPQPTSDVGQVLYFFPGFEDANGVQSILQPVLAWGSGQWSIASWNCCLSGIITNSPAVNVSPGDQIYGSITSTCAAGALSCVSWNVLTLDVSTGESTTLGDTPSDGQVFNWAFGGVLEPYYITTCDDYPSGGHVNFYNITVFNENLKRLAITNWSGPGGVVNPNPPRCDYGVQAEGHEVTLSY